MTADDFVNVLIDGKPAQRPLAYVEPQSRGPALRWPEVQDDEEVLWRVGSDVPVIVKTK